MVLLSGPSFYRVAAPDWRESGGYVFLGPAAAQWAAWTRQRRAPASNGSSNLCTKILTKVGVGRLGRGKLQDGPGSDEKQWLAGLAGGELSLGGQIEEQATERSFEG